MGNEIDVSELAKQIRGKRGNRGLRSVAEEIGGVSASTLSRIEQGKVPDLQTFIRICRWLGVSADSFTKSDEDAAAEANLNEPEIVSLHLRADRVLDPKTAKSLVNMLQLAVAAIDEGELGKQRGKHAPRIQKLG